ncbi:MAG: RNA methyltransferase [Betaproteobacteria bacterium]|nr:RNA methyltransferase [Betaproteobacteria bacterium]
MRTQLRLIRSRDNPRIKALLRLARSGREQRASGTAILDGERLIDAYRSSGRTAEVVLASEAACESAPVRALMESAPARARLLLSESLVRQISQVVTSSGVVAIVRIPEPGALPERIANCLLLEGVQDPGNLGSILRSAAAAAIEHVFLSPGSAYAWSPKAVRAGMGAHFALSIHEGVRPASLVPRALGQVIATGPQASRTLFEADLRGPVAWLFGNEASGLSEEARRVATAHVRIPMPGAAESLNVAASVAICLFEQLRQRHAAQVPAA